MVVSTPDHYATLGIVPGASAEEIKASYRRLSRELHPDRNTAPDANRRMAAVNEAYAVLSDPARRAEHDRTLARHRPSTTGNGTVRGYTGSAGEGRATPFAEARRAGNMRARAHTFEFAKPPANGPGALQPEKLPDWYAFLGLPRFASPSDAITAWRAMSARIRTARYTDADKEKLLAQLREAWETLTTPATRAIYDDALAGVPPPPGQFAHLHPNWYTFLGVRPTATADRIAERVTDLSAQRGRQSRDYRAIEEAWRTLRDPESRAAYDASLGLG